MLDKGKRREVPAMRWQWERWKKGGDNVALDEACRLPGRQYGSLSDELLLQPFIGDVDFYGDGAGEEGVGDECSDLVLKSHPKGCTEYAYPCVPLVDEEVEEFRLVSHRLSSGDFERCYGAAREILDRKGKGLLGFVHGRLWRRGWCSGRRSG